MAVLYLIMLGRCDKIYFGSGITSFREHFNNHKSSVERCEGTKCMVYREDRREKKGLGAYKLNNFVPLGLNV